MANDPENTAPPAHGTARLEGGGVAIFLPSLEGGGAERAVLQLAGELAARGLHITLVLAARTGPYLDEVPDPVRVVDLGGGRVRRALVPLARYLRAHRPAVLFSALDHANLIALWAERLAGSRTRVVVSVRNVVSAELRHASMIHRWLMPRVLGREYRRAHRVVCISDAIADDFAKLTGFPRSQLTVIPNSLPVARIRSAAASVPGHPWLLPGGPPVLVSVGRLVPQKDHLTLIRALAILKRSRPARLILLGEGPLRDRLHAEIRALGLEGDVDMPGFARNPHAIVARASCFVLSSEWEGLGNVVLEALALGTPVVSTDCVGAPRELLLDGALGDLVPVGDAAALAAAIARTLDHPPSAAALRRRAEEFSPEVIVPRYIEALGLSITASRASR